MKLRASWKLAEKARALKTLELIYKTLGQMFVIYGENNPQTLGFPSSLQLDESKNNLIEAVGALQLAWHNVGAHADEAFLQQLGNQHDCWEQQYRQFSRIQSRVSVWMSWQRRLSVICAAERRLFGKIRLSNKEETSKIADFEKIAVDTEARLKVAIEVQQQYQKNSRAVDDRFQTCRQILESN